jgi:hypothetical protein
LEQVFDRNTKKKARHGKDWRLLIVDGHSSHLTNKFLDYCINRKIFVAVFPPHSTHTLQPLDVVCFKPSSSAYSKKLAEHTQQSQGLVLIKKGDFFLLFWDSWQASFKKETIVRSFAATGVWPIDRDRVMKRFPPKLPNKLKDSSTPAWFKAERLLHAAIDRSSSEAKEVTTLLHHLTAQNDLLNDENNGLREAFNTKKKHNKKSNVLDLQQRDEYHSGAVFWSPRKLREARARNSTNKRLQEAKDLKKAEMKKLKAANTLCNKKIAEEKRVAQERAKVVSNREKAEKAAIAAAKKADLNTRKSLPTA